MGVRDSDDIAGYSPPVHRFGGSAGGAAVCAQAAAADGPARDLGRGSRLGGAAGGVFAGHGESSAGVVDPLHGNGDSFHAAVFVGYTQHYAAGSGLCVRESLYFGGAGAASVEWQLHCVLWPQRGGAEPLSLLLLAVVYGGIFTAMLFVENRRPGPAGKLKITPAGTFVAVVMALTAFAVSNLSFANGSEANMYMFYIRTLVDLAGVLILTVQHEQLREAALHSELAELDGVLHRQYEQDKQSKENIRLINRRYHELKMQIAAIRAERDHAKQDVALAAMESGIRQYEAENKTGNPVLDTLLTAKSLYCQQHHITMTCVVDGHLLDFLETGEICTIVGTALDNATESVETEPDHEKRLIRVAVYAQNGFVMLRFENYCAQEVELGADGLPRRNTHGGSDLRGVRAAAEKRGGTMTLHWENEWFTLRVLLPQKS